MPMEEIGVEQDLAQDLLPNYKCIRKVWKPKRGTKMKQNTLEMLFHSLEIIYFIEKILSLTILFGCCLIIFHSLIILFSSLKCFSILAP